MSKHPALDPESLAQFTGSEKFYYHSLVRDVIFTDGAKYVADAAGAYWLLDEIALAQRYDPALAEEEFQVWELKVSTEGSALLICEDGNGRQMWSKRINWTNFPQQGIRFYLSNKCIHLPSEY